MIKDFRILIKLLDPRKAYNLYFFKPIKGFSIDTRTIKRGQAYIAICGKHKDGHQYIPEAVKKGARLIIATKNISNKPQKIPYFLVDDTYKALAILSRYVRDIKKPFVYAITGSVGKTTTKEMLAFLLEEKFKIYKNFKTENNILGVAKTIFSLKDEDILVLELGTNKIGELKVLAQMAYPDVAIITFIKPVHLEGLGSLNGIFREKTALLKVNPRIKAVLNGDDKYLRKVDFCNKIHWFGQNKNNDIYESLLKTSLKESKFLINDRFILKLKTPFTGFIYNAMAAILAAKLKGISLLNLVNRLSKFNNFCNSRMQMEKINNLIVINDAYNANPYAVKEVLRTVRNYPYRKIAIIADMLELGKEAVNYHKDLAWAVRENNFEYCLTIGRYSKYLNSKLKQLGYSQAYHFLRHEAIADFIKNKIIPSNDSKRPFMVLLKGSRAMALEKVLHNLR